ncbi:hypothetical protein REPUB_Repub06bG0222200 [Reevesia pubescens]
MKKFEGLATREYGPSLNADYKVGRATTGLVQAWVGSHARSRNGPMNIMNENMTSKGVKGKAVVSEVDRGTMVEEEPGSNNCMHDASGRSNAKTSKQGRPPKSSHDDVDNIPFMSVNKNMQQGDFMGLEMQSEKCLHIDIVEEGVLSIHDTSLETGHLDQSRRQP